MERFAILCWASARVGLVHSAGMRPRLHVVVHCCVITQLHGMLPSASHADLRLRLGCRYDDKFSTSALKAWAAKTSIPLVIRPRCAAQPCDWTAAGMAVPCKTMPCLTSQDGVPAALPACCMCSLVHFRVQLQPLPAALLQCSTPSGQKQLRKLGQAPRLVVAADKEGPELIEQLQKLSKSSDMPVVLATEQARGSSRLCSRHASCWCLQCVPCAAG